MGSRSSLAHRLILLLACLPLTAVLIAYQQLVPSDGARFHKIRKHIVKHAIGGSSSDVPAAVKNNQASEQFALRPSFPERSSPTGSSIAPPPPIIAQPPHSLGGCARLRTGHFLVYASHSGFGNQELSLRRALLLAYVLNRTLVLPPVLRQSDLSFGPPEVRCRNASWAAHLQMRAEQLYERKLSGSTDIGYESLRAVFNFEAIEALGISVLDYRHLARPQRLQLREAPLAPLGCTKSDRYNTKGLQAALESLHSIEIVRMGSPYFLHANLSDLRRADICFHAISRAVLQLPFSGPVHQLGEAAVRRILMPFASVHLRLSDGGAATLFGPGVTPSLGDASTTVALSSERRIEREVRWLEARLARRLPANCCRLYVASNIPGGIRSPLLSQLCGARAAFNCTDSSSLGVRHMSEWHEMLAATRLSASTGALLVDLAISAAAGRGFFSTSKFCGPAGFRRSTFSEGIALRWQQLHGSLPLCVHAMEHALIEGMTARGTFVY